MREPSVLVSGILRAGRGLGRISPYRLVLRLCHHRPVAAEVYVAAWLLVLGVMLAVTDVAGVFAALVATFRFVDLMAYQSAILLDRRARSLASFPRTLVLGVMNLLELVIGLAIVAKWELDLTAPHALYESFNVVFARSTSLDSTQGMKVVTALAIGGSLVLAAGILGMVIGLIGAGFKETRPRRSRQLRARVFAPQGAMDVGESGAPERDLEPR